MPSELTVVNRMNRCYSELIQFNTFEERFNYLKLNQTVGKETFGFKRYLNQFFYHHNHEWEVARNKVIIRDNGCDLGMPDHGINGSIYIHHLNVITIEDLINEAKWIIDPEYLICTSFYTHQAIHYSNENILPKDYVPRKPNDTIPWRISK